jgi:Domain of unknown function (DUF4123)
MTIWIAWCSFTAADGNYEVPVALRCQSQAQFISRINQWVATQNWALISVDQALPAADWHSANPDFDVAALAETALATDQLVNGAYARLPPVATLPDLHISDIPDVVPLDSQLGMLPKRTTPMALRDALFGASGPSDQKVRGTFAILDAAKIPTLPDMLADSGLPYRCLFQGKALDDLHAVAPYIVALTEDHKFTRSLFTDAGMPGDLWGKSPGIYLRSAEPLDDLWKHFRKFTRLQDTNGKWYFWRFWDHDFFGAARHFQGTHWLRGMEFAAWVADHHVFYLGPEQCCGLTTTPMAGRRPPIHPQALAVLDLAMCHPDLATTFAKLPADHWIVRHLGRLQSMPGIAAPVISRLVNLPAQAPSQRICAGLLADGFLNPSDVIAALNHVLKRI